MKILITGASGMIGKALQKSFAGKGYEMLLATRSKPEKPNEIQWDTKKGFADEDLPRLESLDAIVHLAGENIAGRWTDEKKRRLMDSRVDGTRNIVETIGKLVAKPKVLLNASAIGIYGDRADELMTEDSAAGDTFLAEIGKNWEAEAVKAEDFGVRVVRLRIGIVLAKDGGALAQMLTPFKFGLGGTIGSGKQWMSWIALEDIVRIFNFALENENLSGAVNTVAPNPATNEEFTDTLGAVVHRPTFLPLPAFAVNLAFGEMGDALLLASTRVVPKKLEEAGFMFDFPDLKTALEQAIK
ncbi:MAG: TIGR01777 family oxidoreductase [Acidobacteriota bacterium]|nr:TIGR01777 family oxidoreductase [Acidobacteriota bacterium]